MEDKKQMNLIQLTFIVAVNMMGSGIIMLPTNMAKVGAISLLSWIVTALGSMAIAYGFAQAGLFNQRPGGMSAYAEDAYGKSGYFLTFFLYFLSLAIGNVAMNFSYKEGFGGNTRSAYATLLNDCLRGDATLFDRADSVEAAWALVDPILDVWSAAKTATVPEYPAGTWGPKESDQLLERDGRQWYNP